MKLQKRNNGVYYLAYRNNDKLCFLSLKTTDIKKANSLLIEYQNGKIKLPSKIKKEKTENLHYLVFQYLKHCELNFSITTQKPIRSHFRFILKNSSSTLQISEVTPLIVSNIINLHCSIYQKELCYSYFNMFFNWCLNYGYCENNPITKIKKPKRVQKLPVYINESELQKILSGIQNLDNIELKSILYDITLLAFYSGFRLSEITSLRWSQVNFQNQTIQLDNQNTTTKSKKFRVVPISNKILPMLEVRHQKRLTNMVFHHNFSVRNFNDLVSKNFKRVIKQLPEINPKMKFHGLRHSFCSALLNTGNINLVTVSKLVGHQNIATTMIYSHISDTVLRNAIDTL